MTHRAAALLIALSLLCLPAWADEREWESHGPYGGPVWYVLPVGPPGRLLATTASGTYITDDAGLHWRLLDSELRLDGVVNQTADVAWGWNYQSLYRSSDAGLTWSRVESGGDHWGIHKLAFDLNVPSTLYLAESGSRSEDGAALLRSVNGAVTWTRLPLPSPPEDVIVTPSTVLVDTYDNLYSSVNGGTTWNAVFPDATVNLSGIAQDPANPSRVYCLTTVGTLYSSSNGGLTWQNTGQLDRQNYTLGGMAVDPHDPRVLYVWDSDGQAIARSENAGASCETLPSRYDFYQFALDPYTPGRIWAASAGGVRMSDAGGPWVRRSTGLPNTSVSAIAFDPRDPSTVYAGTRYDGLQKSTDAGDTWEDLGLDSAEVGIINCVGIYPKSPSTIFVGSWKGIFRSTDAGKTWSLSDTCPNGVYSIIAKSRRILAATSSGLYMSRDSGETWQPTGFNSDPVDALTDAGRGFLYLSYNRDIWLSVNSGLTWKRMGRAGMGGTALAADPLRPWNVYAITWRQLLKSSDCGRTWEPFDHGLFSWDNKSVMSLVFS
ncbi:MAG: hypothetical protein EHM89_16265, partial [Acidobacteria bacterium]